MSPLSNTYKISFTAVVIATFETTDKICEIQISHYSIKKALEIIDSLKTQRLKGFTFFAKKLVDKNADSEQLIPTYITCEKDITESCKLISLQDILKEIQKLDED